MSDNVARRSNSIDIDDYDTSEPASNTQRRPSFQLPGFDILRPNKQSTISSNENKDENENDGEESTNRPPLSKSSDPKTSQRQNWRSSKFLSPLHVPSLNNDHNGGHNNNEESGKKSDGDFSIAKGLFQVQSGLENSFAPGPLTPAPTANARDFENDDQASQSSKIPQEMATDPHYGHDHVNAPIHLVHADDRKIKKSRTKDKYSNSKVQSLMTKANTHIINTIAGNNDSSDSLAPLISRQMLRDPVLSDLSQYDGRNNNLPALTFQHSIREYNNKDQNQKYAELEDAQKAYNHTDLLSRQIYQINAAADDLKTHEKAVQVLVENQRGWFILGFPFFSSNVLMPTDPVPWTSGNNGSPSPGGIACYQLPDPSWKWTWPQWYVDMAYDVDDQGWSYSWRFGSDTWHGSHVWFHSFVRRRRWIRVCHRGLAKDDRCGYGFEKLREPPNPLLLPENVKGSNTTLPLLTPIPSATRKPGSPTASVRSIRSTVSSIVESPKNEQRDRWREDTAQQYGNNYFAIPPAGRISSTLSSPRHQAAPISYGSLNQQYPINTGVETGGNRGRNSSTSTTGSSSDLRGSQKNQFGNLYVRSLRTPNMTKPTNLDNLVKGSGTCNNNENNNSSANTNSNPNFNNNTSTTTNPNPNSNTTATKNNFSTNTSVNANNQNHNHNNNVNFKNESTQVPYQAAGPTLFSDFALDGSENSHIFQGPVTDHDPFHIHAPAAEPHSHVYEDPSFGSGPSEANRTNGQNGPDGPNRPNRSHGTMHVLDSFNGPSKQANVVANSGPNSQPNQVRQNNQSNSHHHDPVNTLSELFLDLDSARIDRERIEIITSFIADPCNLPALEAANNDDGSTYSESISASSNTNVNAYNNPNNAKSTKNASSNTKSTNTGLDYTKSSFLEDNIIDWSQSGLIVGDNEYRYHLRILGTLVHLDSKIHLIDHIREAIHVWKTRLQHAVDAKKQGEDEEKEEEGRNKEDTKDSSDGINVTGQNDETSVFEKQCQYLVRYINELGKMEYIDSQLVNGQQYYISNNNTSSNTNTQAGPKNEKK